MSQDAMDPGGWGDVDGRALKDFAGVVAVATWLAILGLMFYPVVERLR